ncbi:MAG: HEAT repeat domain-containing protein [Gemmatimonadota bacterium]
MSTQMAGPVEAMPSLPGELTDLLIELAAGLQRARVYGPRHPAVREAAHSFVARNAGRKRDRGTLSVGAAGRHLIVELRPAAQLTRSLGGVATGLEHPLLGALAGRLSAHEVFAIDIAEGVAPQEIAALLSFLASDPAQTGRPLGRETDGSLAALPSLRVHRGTRDLGPGRDGGEPDAPAPDPEVDARLWSDLARTALALPSSYAERAYSAEEVATAISARAGNPEFWRQAAEPVRNIASRLGRAGPLESRELARAFSAVLRRLDVDTLRVLLSASGDARLQARLLGDVAGALDVDIVLELVRVAAEDEASDISRWMLRLLSKLARHAGEESGATATRSDAALREQIRALVSGWDLENPNAEDYEETLVRSMSGAGGSDDRDAARSGTVQSAVEPSRTVAIALEAGIDGPPVWGAVERMIRGGRISRLVSQLESVGPSSLADRVWQRLCDRPVLQLLVQEEEPDWDVLDRILPRAGLDAAQPLLDRLMAADSLAVRRRLFDRLVGLGPAVGEPAVRCLGQTDETPWYVLRNVLSLLSLLGCSPEGFDPWPLTAHAHPQVRLEAVKLCLLASETRDAAILRALVDPSSRIVALGIVEAESGCPPGAEERLAQIAGSDEEGEFSEFRTHAIRALARLGSEGARETLLEVASPRRRGLRRGLPEPSPALRAAVRGLAERWPDDPRAREVLELARDSDDADTRKAAS